MMEKIMSNTLQDTQEVQSEKDKKYSIWNGLYLVNKSTYSSLEDAIANGGVHRVSDSTDLTADSRPDAVVLAGVMLMIQKSLSVVGQDKDWDLFWFDDGRHYDVSEVDSVFCAGNDAEQPFKHGLYVYDSAKNESLLHALECGQADYKNESANMSIGEESGLMAVLHAMVDLDDDLDIIGDDQSVAWYDGEREYGIRDLALLKKSMVEGK